MMKIKKFQFNNKYLLKEALGIRHKVFVIGQNCPEEIEYEYEEESTHFLVLEDNIPVATARHRQTKKGVKLERFAVLKEKRKKGYGKMILQTILDDLKYYEGDIYLHAQIQVIPFYEKLGFKKKGEKFEEANIIHYKMYLHKK